MTDRNQDPDNRSEAANLAADLLSDLAAMRPRVRKGSIVRFNRSTMNHLFTYAAIFAGGVWYVTGSLKGRRTFEHEEMVAVLAEEETTDLAVADTWAAVTWTD